MPKPERRHSRSAQTHLALNLFLESLRQSEGIDAVAVTSSDGFLIGGAGDLDVEWMGALGAYSMLKTLAWEERTLHVQKLDINRVLMFLTSAGKPVSASTVQLGLERICCLSGVTARRE